MQIYIFKNVHSLTLCPKGTQKPSNLHSSPKCWHDISNINIYIQLTYIPQTVGSIYPIQIYISKNVHSLTLGPKGTQKPSKLHSSPKFRHEISISAFKISISGLKMLIYSLKILMYGLKISLSGLKILISGLRISISGFKMSISGLIDIWPENINIWSQIITIWSQNVDI